MNQPFYHLTTGSQSQTSNNLLEMLQAFKAAMVCQHTKLFETAETRCPDCGGPVETRLQADGLITECANCGKIYE